MICFIVMLYSFLPIPKDGSNQHGHLFHQERSVQADVAIRQNVPVKVFSDTVIYSIQTTPTDVFIYHPVTPEIVIFKNNTIVAQNTDHHIVLLGSESSAPTDRMLDGIIITGNKIVWMGTSLTDNNEGILVGYSVNALICYNLLQNCPYGTPLKASGLTNTKGGVAYNVYGPSFKVATGAKGISGSRFYNNTFYNERRMGEGAIGSVYLNSNNDLSTSAASPASKNCEIFNNIFYTKHQVPNIYADQASLEGLQCDYNIYFCEDGEPVFRIAGQTITFSVWRKMGYDKHSLILNPKFIDLNNLIPSAPLPYGKDLGKNWQMGLSPEVQWQGAEPVLKAQGAVWQVGAYVY